MNGKAMRSVDSISESEEINDHPDNHTMDSSSDGRSLLSMASFDNCSILSMELNEVRTRNFVNKLQPPIDRFSLKVWQLKVRQSRCSRFLCVALCQQSLTGLNSILLQL